MQARKLVAPALISVAVISSVTPLPAAAGGRSLHARLKGESEVCTGGADCNDPNGTGRAKLRLVKSKQKVCYDIRWRRIQSPYAAHIHEAPAGKEGPVVVTLFEARDLSRSVRGVRGCAKRVDKELIDEISDRPRQFYVNVHTPRYEGGAIRGQLKP